MRFSVCLSDLDEKLSGFIQFQRGIEFIEIFKEKFAEHHVKFPEIGQGRYAYVCNQQYAWSGFDPPSSRAGFDTGSAQQVHGQAAGKRRRTSVLLRLLPEQHGAPDVGWAENMKHMQWFSGKKMA